MTDNKTLGALNERARRNRKIRKVITALYAPIISDPDGTAEPPTVRELDEAAEEIRSIIGNESKPAASESAKISDAAGENQDGKAAQQHHSNTVPPELFHDFEQAKYLYYANARIFAQLAAHLEKRAADGLPVDQDAIAAYLRGHDFVTDTGEDFKVNHNYGAAWARFIRRDNPDLAPHIVLRKSRFDRFFE